MNFLLWIILGWFVGLLANWIMGVKDRGSLIVTWMVGIAGALIGGFIGSALGLTGLPGLDMRSLLIAVGGSAVMLAAYRTVRGALN